MSIRATSCFSVFASGLLGFTFTAPAQLVMQDLTQGLTPEDLVAALVGPGVTIENIQFSGADVAAGKVSGGAGIIGFADGIVLSTGCISNAVAEGGMNNSNSITCDNQEPGDADLDGLIPGYTTFDRCVLEFDFECENIQVISFQYVFSSDEYNEYANTDFNDVFGFFVNGENVALLPDGMTPVSINNVNCGNPEKGADPTPHNCQYFVNNACQGPPGFPDIPYPCTPPLQTEMDGMTVMFFASAVVHSGVNHIKIAIADAGDHVLDSNVFVRTQSFTCTPAGKTGACCLPDGTCSDDLPGDCAEDGGVFHPDVDCATFSCSAPFSPADLNRDGHVDGVDLGVLLLEWSLPPTAPGCSGLTPCPPDINNDGFVNGVDLGLLLNAWTF